MSRPRRPCSVTGVSGGLLVQTPYDPGFLAAIKSIPTSERRFDPNTKGWLIHPKHGARVGQMIEQCYGELVMVPQVSAKQTPDLRVLDIRYVGVCKDRGDEVTAYGYSNREWSVIFPEDVLRQWFEGVVTQAAQPKPVGNTLYAVLGIHQTVTADEIKTAYRRMARQWHPDICKEPDAHERFIKIKEAYELLSDPDRRTRYDGGLAMEAMLSKRGEPASWSATSAIGAYRAPLRCGWVLAEGIETLGLFRVSQILDWQDITNDAGQTLVVSWPAGSDRFVETWV